jgi:isocitrate dehydrogenase kinase/phosphatase
MKTNEVPHRVSAIILDHFETYASDFLKITLRAKEQFENRNWQGGRRDAVERLDLYDDIVSRTAHQLNHILDDKKRDKTIWKSAKQNYAKLIAGHKDEDLAETFFNSITRKILMTVGLDREIEFFYLHPKAKKVNCDEPFYKTFYNKGDTAGLVKEILTDCKFNVKFENIDRDSDRIAREIDLYLWPQVGNHQSYPVEIIEPLFYRNKRAYLVGRIRINSHTIPLILPLVNGESGIYVDTVLLHHDDVNIVFSFAFSYFHVQINRHDALVDFLKSLMPQKEPAEIYTSIGHNRHGKTELYRNLHRFIHITKEQFVPAPGEEGAVMVVFTLQNFNFVFKVIKDRPCFIRSKYVTSKTIRRQEVIFKYDFVSHRDRAGRMVDTQEFENLKFKKKRFSKELLNEFDVIAKESVVTENEYVIIKHLYVQRKVIPLPIYFQKEKNPELLRNVIIDFGYFLKDIAAIGVFPGDLFNTWNYGVTEFGRVVLYDYDDVIALEQVNFKEKPTPKDECEEMEPEENWIIATADDFFLDEIDRYSGIPNPLKGIFKSIHADLYTLKFWDGTKAKVRSGELVDIIPYDRKKRFNIREE